MIGQQANSPPAADLTGGFQQRAGICLQQASGIKGGAAAADPGIETQVLEGFVQPCQIIEPPQRGQRIDLPIPEMHADKDRARFGPMLQHFRVRQFDAIRIGSDPIQDQCFGQRAAVAVPHCCGDVFQGVGIAIWQAGPKVRHGPALTLATRDQFSADPSTKCRHPCHWHGAGQCTDRFYGNDCGQAHLQVPDMTPGVDHSTTRGEGLRFPGKPFNRPARPRLPQSQAMLADDGQRT